MKYSVVIPVYNEKNNLDKLKKSLIKVLDTNTHEWELIFVDDGSEDGSFGKLTDYVREQPEKIIALSLRRNFGQTAAIAAGIDIASGDVLILIDADLQNDPRDIPLLIDKMNEGYDVVSGWRFDRKDNYLTRTIPSKIANKLISWVTGVRLHDYGCTLKAYKKEVLEGFRLYGEMHRFIPAYAGYVGARITEVKVRHHPRRFGETNYGLERTLKVVLDLFTVKFLISYSQKPLYLFGGVSLFLFLIGGGILLFLSIRRLGIGVSPFSSPLFPTSIMFVLMSFQSILMGLIAELLVRTYHEAQDKPTYTIRERVGGEKGKV